MNELEAIRKEIRVEPPEDASASVVKWTPTSTQLAIARAFADCTNTECFLPSELAAQLDIPVAEIKATLEDEKFMAWLGMDLRGEMAKLSALAMKRLAVMIAVEGSLDAVKFVLSKSLALERSDTPVAPIIQVETDQFAQAVYASPHSNHHTSHPNPPGDSR